MLNIDIIDMILKVLKSQGCRGGLLSTALSCRLFSEIALNHLWHEMDDIDPLLLLLPGLLEIDSELVIKGPLTEAGCSRFWRYSKRIRELYISGYAPRARYHSIYMRLQVHAQFRGLDMLPSLEILEYNRITDDHSLWLLEFPMLLSTKVKTLDLSTSGIETYITEMIWAVVDRCCPLRDFRIQHAPSSLLTILLHLTSLETLNLDQFPVSPELFYFLRRSPKLVKLDIIQSQFNDEAIDHPSQMLSLPKDLLPSLKDLGLIMHEHDTLYLLQHISSKTLEAIYLQIRVDSGRSCMEAISMFTSLNVVNLSLLTDKEHKDNPIDILSVIPPLLSLPHIREFAIHIHSSAGVTITTDIVPAIASSWKHLEKLVINENNKPSMTGMALGLIALHCKNLMELQITLDLTDLTYNNLPQSSPSTMLGTLHLLRSTSFNDVELVNKFVQSLFPHLKKYEVYDGESY